MLPISPALIALTLSGSLGTADVAALIESRMPHWLGTDSLHWSLASPWAPLAMPPGAAEVRLVPPSGTLRPGMVSCLVQVVDSDGRPLRTAAAAVRCERVGAGLRLRRAARAGEVLTEADFERTHAVLPSGDRPLSEPSDAVGKRLRRTLAQDSWLTPAALEAPPVVARGAALRVSAHSESFVVRFQAVAQQEAALGQVIRARGPRAGSLVRVRITGPGLAELVP